MNEHAMSLYTAAVEIARLQSVSDEVLRLRYDNMLILKKLKLAIDALERIKACPFSDAPHLQDIAYGVLSEIDDLM